MEYGHPGDQCKYLKLYPSKDTETKKHILVSQLFKQEIVFIRRFISQGGGGQLVVTIDITTIHTHEERSLTCGKINSCHNWTETLQQTKARQCQREAIHVSCYFS